MPPRAAGRMRGRSSMVEPQSSNLLRGFDSRRLLHLEQRKQVVLVALTISVGPPRHETCIAPPLWHGQQRRSWSAAVVSKYCIRLTRCRSRRVVEVYLSDGRD